MDFIDSNSSIFKKKNINSFHFKDLPLSTKIFVVVVANFVIVIVVIIVVFVY